MRMPLLLMSQAILPQTVLGVHAVHANAWLDAVPTISLLGHPVQFAVMLPLLPVDAATGYVRDPCMGCALMLCCHAVPCIQPA